MKDKPISLRLSEWQQQEIVGKVKNKSARIIELMLKGYLIEQKEKLIMEYEEINKQKGLYTSWAGYFLQNDIIDTTIGVSA